MEGNSERCTERGFSFGNGSIRIEFLENSENTVTQS